MHRNNIKIKALISNNNGYLPISISKYKFLKRFKAGSL